MKKIIRDESVLHYICQHIVVDFYTLQKHFDISLSTIHRILKSLHPWVKIDKNKVIYMPFSHFKYKDLAYEQNKNAIAYKATKLVQDDDTICLAGGSTTIALMVPFIILHSQNVFIITNNIYAISLYLALRDIALAKNISILIVGGLFQYDSFSLTGEYALNLIKNFSIDKTFISTQSVNKRGFFVNELSYAYVEKCFLENSHKNYILANKEKFGKELLFRWGEWKEFDGIITDYTAPLHQREGFQVILSDPFTNLFT